MARFPPKRWEIHPITELDRLEEEIMGVAPKHPLQAAAFMAVR
jgi:hypothetical protein